MRARLRRVPLLALTPVLAVLTLTAWVFASPVGAGPDDDFHLVSAWCAGPTADETCAPAAEPGAVEAPAALASIACYAYQPEKSAACQGESWSWSVEELVQTARSNVAGSYPPVFYAVMGSLTGEDIQLSALLMRILTVVLFVGITAALYGLLPSHRRATLLWSWILTSVPLGLFLFGTNNPSSWAWIGVGSSWLALLGYFETTGRRKALLGAVFALTAVMSAGARADAALFTGLGIAVVLLLTATRRRRYLAEAILPVAVGIMALALFLGSYFSRDGVSGFTGASYDDPLRGGDANAGLERFLEGSDLAAYNALHVPTLWTGVLGDWALGWLDTSMPAVVSAAAVGAIVAVGFAGLTRMTVRKALAIAAVIAILVALPLVILQSGTDTVGNQVQARYILPLVTLLIGLVLLAPRGRPIVLSLAQRVTVVLALSAAQFVALHINIRRYVTGIDESGPSLDAGVEWWWAGTVGPNAVWLLGSLAYTLLLAILVGRIARPAAVTDDHAAAPRRASPHPQPPEVSP